MFNVIKKTAKIIFGKTITKMLQQFFYKNDLNKLANLYGTDKLGRHNYTPIYNRYFKPYVNNKITLLEIGIGGYEDTTTGGASLRMWKNYFKKGKIVGIDIYDKRKLSEDRIEIFKGDQSDIAFLQEVITRIGHPDIIIDDGSHINSHVITSFRFLFPKLRQGGTYIIEDTQTSYWEEMGGNPTDLNSPNTIMAYFKQLTDAVNSSEYNKTLFFEKEMVELIESVAFFHNLIIISKKCSQ